MRLWLIILTLFFFLPIQVFAKYDPRTVPNNIYGIHIIDPNDLNDVSTLVNSTGGDWGYVTLVIPETDRNESKWSNIFHTLHKKHLIPIVRLATSVEDGNWKIPKQKTITDWVTFLSALHWPTENRYIILYNEPNHANEWGGSIDPSGYVQIADDFAKQLHEASGDFFILPAALDVSADGTNGTMDAATFLEQTIRAQKDFYTHIDGWNSHSYPNPGFSGSPYGTGRGSLRSYTWELSYLANAGIQSNFPVFITETGWEHSEGKYYNAGKLTSSQVASNLTIASQTVWQDPRIVAITPFVFNYQDNPFDHFSWKMLGSADYYAPFYAYQNIPKTKGKPKQRQSYTLTSDFIPDALVRGKNYTFSTTIKNIGQNTLSPDDGYMLDIQDDKHSIIFYPNSVPTLEPGEEGPLVVQFSTPKAIGQHTLTLRIGKENDWFTVKQAELTILSPPEVLLHIPLAWRKENNANHVTFLVYDNKNQVLEHKRIDLELKNGQIRVEDLDNIIPGTVYRLVVLVPQYLPRQMIAPIGRKETTIWFPRLFPLDLDSDGTFTWHDFVAVINTSPRDIEALWW